MVKLGRVDVDVVVGDVTIYFVFPENSFFLFVQLGSKLNTKIALDHPPPPPPPPTTHTNTKLHDRALGPL